MIHLFLPNNIFNYGRAVYDCQTGGGFRDVGNYPLAYFNYLIDDKIKDMSIYSIDNSTGTDVFTVGMIKYEKGVIAQTVGGIELLTENKAMIYGTKGYLELPNFWKSGQGKLVIDNKEYLLNEEMLSDFYYEIDHFSNLILDNKKESPIATKELSLSVARAYDLIHSKS